MVQILQQKLPFDGFLSSKVSHYGFGTPSLIGPRESYIVFGHLGRLKDVEHESDNGKEFEYIFPFHTHTKRAECFFHSTP